MRSKLQEMPYDKAAEYAVVGSMILDNDMISRVVEHVSTEDVYTPELKLIYGIIKEIWSQGEAADAVTIRSRFNGKPDEEQLFQALRDSLDHTPSAANAVYYAKQVHRKAVERNLIQIVHEAKQKIIDSNEPLEDKIQMISELMTNCPTLNEKKDSVMCELVEKYFSGGTQTTPIPTGYSKLDIMLGGFRKGELILIGGPTSIGKSSFLIDIFIHNLRMGANPYLISLEMLNNEVVERMIRNIARVTTPIDLEDKNVIDAGMFLSGCVGSLSEKRDCHIEEIFNQVMAKKQKEDIKIAYIDHLHLIVAPGQSVYQQRTYISNRLKTLAMKCEIPVVVAAQLNRAPRQRRNPRPFMSDLRDSGALEQDADIILLLYSNDYYRKQEEDNPELDGRAECIIAKARNRPTGTMKMVWFPQYSSFREMNDYCEGY